MLKGLKASRTLSEAKATEKSRAINSLTGTIPRRTLHKSFLPCRNRFVDGRETMFKWAGKIFSNTALSCSVDSAAREQQWATDPFLQSSGFSQICNCQYAQITGVIGFISVNIQGNIIFLSKIKYHLDMPYWVHILGRQSTNGIRTQFQCFFQQLNGAWRFDNPFLRKSYYLKAQPVLEFLAKL